MPKRTQPFATGKHEPRTMTPERLIRVHRDEKDIGIHAEGAGFKPLIEKYGLLHNLDTERFLSKPDHKSFFKEQAYQGSQP